MSSIIIVPTLRCDRGCSHCMCDSGPSGESLSPSLLSSLPREIRALRGRIKQVCITGGGEPLLYPWLPELVEAMFTSGVDTNLVTSGCRSKEDTGFAVLDRITSAFRGRKLQIFLSYNEYNSTSAERLRFTLPLARKVNGHATIKVALSYANRQPIVEIDHILKSMGYSNALKAVSGERVDLSLGWTQDQFGEYSDFTDSIYFRPNDFAPSDDFEEGFCGYGSHLVTVSPHNLRVDGRLDQRIRDFDELLDHTSLKPTCPHLRGEDEAYLIDATGHIYPCVMVLPQNNPAFAVGKLGETPFWQAVSRRDSKLSEMRMKALQNSRLHSNCCGYCCEDDRTGA